VCARAVFDESGFAFDNAAVAFTASGQSIIADDVAPNSRVQPDVGAGILDSMAGFEADLEVELAAGLPRCLAQQS